MQSADKGLLGTSHVGRHTDSAVRSAFLRLPNRERMAITLHQIEGLDSRMIAAALGISGSEARGALVRGYRRLQRSHESVDGARG